MNFLSRYSGMFLMAALVIGALAGICIYALIKIAGMHIKYRKELNLATATRKEVEAQLALEMEVENLLFILLLDFINSTDATNLVYKTTILQQVVLILEADPTFVRDVRSAMLRPGGTQPILHQIIGQQLQHLNPTTAESYIRTAERVDDLKQVCQETEAARDKALQALALDPQPQYQSGTVHKSALNSVQMLTADGSVKLVFDHETAEELNKLRDHAEAAESAEKTDSDDDSE